MASGNTLAVFQANQNQPTLGSNPASYGRLNGGPVLVFPKSFDREAKFGDLLTRSYGGGGIDVTLVWCNGEENTGNVDWAVSFERQGTGYSMATDSFASAKTASAAIPATDYTLSYTTISFSNSEIDGLLAGESFRLKIIRDTDDTATGNIYLLRVELVEA